MSEKAATLRAAGKVLLEEAEKEEAKPPRYSEIMSLIYSSLHDAGLPSELVEKLVIIAAENYFAKLG